MEKAKHKSALLAGTDADPIRAKATYNASEYQAQKEEAQQIRQKSLYNEKNRARVDNNQFFETRSNPLSSKGN